MNLFCRLFNHRWRHEDRTAFVCERCGLREYGMGYHDGQGECYRPPAKWRSTNGGPWKRV